MRWEGLTHARLAPGLCAALPALLMLQGCASLLLGDTESVSAADAVETVPVPGDWATPAPDALSDTRWVSTFSDELLETYVSEALNNNTDIIAAAVSAAANAFAFPVLWWGLCGP